MQLIKGDVVKQVSPINGFDFVGNLFTVEDINYKDRYAKLRLINLFNNEIVFPVSLECFEDKLYGHASFKKTYVWTPWCEFKDEKKLLSDYIVDNAEYKTNQKIIFLKINGKKVKVTCNKNDVFNLETGLDIAVERWKKKFSFNENNINPKKSKITFREVNKDLFDMPIYYYMAHCISTDYNLYGDTAKKIDALYNMRDKLIRFFGFRSDKKKKELLCLGEALWVDNVFNLVAFRPYQKITMDTLCDCITQLAHQCALAQVTHLAIPHLGGSNLEWGAVKEIIINTFSRFYDAKDSDKIIPIEIVACDNTSIHEKTWGDYLI